MFTVPGLVSGIWLRALQPAAAQSTHSINYCYYHYYYFFVMTTIQRRGRCGMIHCLKPFMYNMFQFFSLSLKGNPPYHRWLLSLKMLGDLALSSEAGISYAWK